MAESPECSPLRVVDAAVAAVYSRAEAAGVALQCDFHFPIPEQIPVSGRQLHLLLTQMLAIATDVVCAGQIGMTCGRFASELGRGVEFKVRLESDLDFQRLRHRLHEPPPSWWREMAEQAGCGASSRNASELASDLGGRLDAYETKDAGQELVFVFEWRESEDELSDASTARERSEFSSAPSEEHRGVVLLADDQPDLLQLITIFMARHDVTVDGAQDGQSAIDMALASRNSGCPYRLIVVDLRMPKLEGTEVATILRKLGWTGPILGTSAYVSSSAWQEGLAAGFDDVLQKPAQPEELCQVLLDYLRGQPSQGGAPSALEQKQPGGLVATGEQARAAEEELASEKSPPCEKSPAGAEQPFSIMQSTALTDEQKAELMSAFLSGLSERADQLEAACDRHDVKELVHCLHALKGAAGVYGVESLRQAAWNAEQAARQSPPRNDVEQLARQLAKSCRELAEQGPG